jgi:hypothetical protein
MSYVAFLEKHIVNMPVRALVSIRDRTGVVNGANRHPELDEGAPRQVRLTEGG